MKCDYCGSDCNYCIYITSEYKKACSDCFDKIRKKKEEIYEQVKKIHKKRRSKWVAI